MRIFMVGQKGIPAVSGGVERSVDELATRLAARGHDVTVYCRAHYTRTRPAEYRGVRLVHLPTIATKHLDAIVHTFLASLHVLKERADIIHYHGIGPALLLWIPRLFAPRAKIVLTFQCQDYHHEKWGWFARCALRLGEAIGCMFAHEVITVSETLTAYVRAAYLRDTTYIPNGGLYRAPMSATQTLRNFGLTHGGYILAVTRLVPHKGIDELIRAYQQLSTTEKLVIVGAGAYTDAYVESLHRFAADNPNIFFLGSRSGNVLASLFAHASIFVQPSRTEGLSLALLEAMQYGLCILASDIPENREALADTGRFFVTDSVADLRDQLQYLLAYSSVRARAGARARTRARRRYGWDRIVRETEALYKGGGERSAEKGRTFTVASVDNVR